MTVVFHNKFDFGSKLDNFVFKLFGNLPIFFFIIVFKKEIANSLVHA